MQHKMADDKIKALVSSTALQKTIYDMLGYTTDGSDVTIALSEVGKLRIGLEIIDVETNAGEFSRQYPYSKVFQLYKILKMISDQPIVIELGYSDWIVIKDIII